jgi:hypothetical protein
MQLHKSYRLASLSPSHKYSSRLHLPDMPRQGTVQHGVNKACGGGVGFGGIPAQLPIREEGDGGDGDCGVAKGEAGVGVGVGLGKGVGGRERCEIRGKSIIGGVLEVCEALAGDDVYGGGGEWTVHRVFGDLCEIRGHAGRTRGALRGAAMLLDEEHRSHLPMIE